jgi:hypothetical protein
MKAMSLNICVDFDGTCVYHEYPNVGGTLPGAVEVQKELVAAGHGLILWTMRCDEKLQDAVNWYAANDIPLYGVQRNPAQDWTTSPKAYAQIYIDDAALGCPLKHDAPRPYVDWVKVRELLVERGAL